MGLRRQDKIEASIEGQYRGALSRIKGKLHISDAAPNTITPSEMLQGLLRGSPTHGVHLHPAPCDVVLLLSVVVLLVFLQNMTLCTSVMRNVLSLLLSLRTVRFLGRGM